MIDKSPRPQSRSSAGMAKSAGKSAKTAAPSKSQRPAARPADLMERFNLERAMGGTDAKAIKQDLKGAGGGSKGGKMGGMSQRGGSRFKDGGCVMAGRGCKYKGSM